MFIVERVVTGSAGILAGILIFLRIRAGKDAGAPSESHSILNGLD